MAFVVRLHTATALRNFVDRVSEVLTELPFQVVNDDSFKGLRINSIDCSTVCCVNAQLRVPQVTGSGNFCVNTQEFMIHLQSIDGDATITLSCDEDDDKVVLEIPGRNGSKRYKIKTIDRDPEEIGLSGFETVHQVHMRAAHLSAYLNLCKRLKYKNVTITIRVVKDAQGREDRYFELSSISDVGSGATHTEVQIGAHTDNNRVELSPDDRPEGAFDGTIPENAEVVYRESFSQKFLSKFCGGARSAGDVLTDITLCGPSKPLIMAIGLGVEDSWVRFVLATVFEEE